VVDTLPLYGSFLDKTISFTGEDHLQTPGLSFTNLADSLLSWTGNVTLAPGASFTITVTGITSACWSGQVSNTAWAYGENTCSNAQAKSVDSGFTLTPAPIFSLVKTAMPTLFVAGQPASYRIVVTNLGVTNITNLNITDTLPANFNYISEEHSAGLDTIFAGGLVYWNNTTLAPGQSWTVTVNGSILSSASGIISNTAWGWASNGTCYQEKSAMVSKTIVAPVLAATASFAISPASPAPGDPVTYTMTIVNSGTVPIKGIWVSDTLPGEISFGSESHPAGFTFGSLGNLLWWNDPAITLAPGASITITLNGTVSSSASGSVSNTASVVIGDGSGGSASNIGTGVFTVAAALSGGEVIIQGGPKGYIEPGKGQFAQIMVRPTGAGTITVRIRSMAGVDVRTLEKNVSGGTTAILIWDGKDKNGLPVPAGVYPAFIDGPGVKYRSKLVLVR